MNRRHGVLLDKLLAQDDRVLEVVALPWHECHQQVLTQRQLTVLGGWTVGKHVADLNALTNLNDYSLVDCSSLVRAVKLSQWVGGALLVVVVDGDLVGVNLFDDTCLICNHNSTGVNGSNALHAGAYIWAVCAKQWHSLTLHVRTHQST